MKTFSIALILSAALLSSAPAMADASGDPTVAAAQDGKYFDKEGNPTYKVGADSTVDWYTYSGFRRYHSECHVCHGPEGEGSSYAPALKTSVSTTINYNEFINVVVNGRMHVDSSNNNVMPKFGDNRNVMCYIDDIFVYMRARANDAVPRGRPQKREDKPQAAVATENACLGPEN